MSQNPIWLHFQNMTLGMDKIVAEFNMSKNHIICKCHVAHLRILVREVAVLAGTQRSRLRRLEELPVAAVDREGE